MTIHPGVLTADGRATIQEEVLLLVKTRRALIPALLQVVRAAHGDDVFEAVALPIAAGSPEYLRWLAESAPAGAGEE